MLAQEHVAELGEAFGRIVERPENALAILNRQRKDHDLHLEGTRESGGRRLVDESCQLANGLGADRYAGELYGIEATR